MFQWDDFLKFASGIHKTPTIPGPVEAAYRSAASRAYYAAFNRALSFAIQVGYKRSDERGKHEDLIFYYEGYKSSEKDTKTEEKMNLIGVKLRHALEFRVEADYYSRSKTKPQELAYSNIKYSGEILSMLDSWR